MNYSMSRYLWERRGQLLPTHPYLKLRRNENNSSNSDDVYATEGNCFDSSYTELKLRKLARKNKSLIGTNEQEEFRMTSPHLLTNENTKVLSINMNKASELTQDGKVYSIKTDIAGLEWYAVAYFNNENPPMSFKSPIALHCEVYCTNLKKDIPWNCHAKIRIPKKCRLNHGMDLIKEEYTSDSNGKIKIEDVIKFDTTGEMYRHLKNGEITVEIEIEVYSCNFLMDFSESDPNLTQVILVAEGHRLHVNKHILAQCSSYFYSMFFSGFEESNKKEIELKDVKYDQFIRFLNICYNQPVEITKDNVGYLLQMADKYDQKIVMDRCEQYLRKAEDVNPVEKLTYTLDYNLYSVQESCLASMTTFAHFQEACRSYEKVTPELAHILLERLLQIDPLKKSSKTRYTSVIYSIN